jgi:hypothetical protein
MAGARNIIGILKSALRTEQGRSAGGKAVDGIGGAVDRATKGKHTGNIDKARRAAHKYLNGGQGGGQQDRRPNGF